MFRRLPEPGAARISFSFEGRPLEAREGDTVATALLAAGVAAFRSTAVSGAERGPWCLMGTCFDCLVEIDGEQNRQACLTPVSEGMQVLRQRGGCDIARSEAGA